MQANWRQVELTESVDPAYLMITYRSTSLISNLNLDLDSESTGGLTPGMMLNDRLRWTIEIGMVGDYRLELILSQSRREGWGSAGSFGSSSGVELI